MKVVFDIETNAYHNPDTIWVIVCKDIETSNYHIFRNLTSDPVEKERFHAFASQVETWIGHNVVEYDCPIINRLLGVRCVQPLDTLLCSRLFDYSRPGGHSIEQYGEDFNFPKGRINDFSRISDDMVDYCQRDVDICHRIYIHLSRYINDPVYHRAIKTEHEFQLLVNDLHDNGFAFNASKAEKLLAKVKEELNVLDKEIETAFPPRLVPVREVTPRRTKFGTLNKSDFRWHSSGDLSEFNGGPFTLCRLEPFNPSSHKQIVRVLAAAGWQPVDKTQTHIDVERDVQRLKFNNRRTKELDIQLQELYKKLEELQKTGWKVNEANLLTLPPSAPSPARTLAKRILYESRRRTLTEWLGCVQKDGRIHGKFYGIGAWSGRMSHQKPNTANIPSEFNTVDNSVKLLGKELRSLWIAPPKRLLVGTDAEGIQLRIFAHYIDDEEFTNALVRGRKSDKSDPHSLNQRILGSVCKSRQAAKRFIYALLLGAGLGKLSQVLGCGPSDTEEALHRLLERYSGFAQLKQEVIPEDAARGYFYGLDGRRVQIPGETVGQRKHLAMSGYLQNGEAVVMKMAAILWNKQLREEGVEYKFVNMVHDEWQTECCNKMDVALHIAKVQADSLVKVGEILQLKCPLAGSYYNDDHKDYTIGTSWYSTH